MFVMVLLNAMAFELKNYNNSTTLLNYEIKQCLEDPP